MACGPAAAGSRMVSVNSAPASALMGASRADVCTSDPSVSTMMATEYPFSLFRVRMRWMRALCQAWSP